MKRFQQYRTLKNGKSRLECRRRLGKNPRYDGIRRTVLAVMITVCLSYVMTGCASGVRGTYTEQGGNYELVLRSGGKANLIVARVDTPCTYTQTGPTITLTCEDYDDSIILTVHDDG